MVGDLLRRFQFAGVLQIRRDDSFAEGMIASPRVDPGCFDDKKNLFFYALEQRLGAMPRQLLQSKAFNCA